MHWQSAEVVRILVEGHYVQSEAEMHAEHEYGHKRQVTSGGDTA